MATDDPQDRRLKYRRREDRMAKLWRAAAWIGFCVIIVIGFRTFETQNRKLKRETEVRIYTACLNGNKRAEQTRLFVTKDLPEIGVNVTPEVLDRANERFKSLKCPPRPAHFDEEDQ